MSIKVEILKYNVKDKQNDIFPPNSIDFSEYMKCPVITKNFDNVQPPIGKTNKIIDTNKSLFAIVEFNKHIEEIERGLDKGIYCIRPTLIKKPNNQYEILDFSLILKENDVYY